jgi:hypothetical protein
MREWEWVTIGETDKRFVKKQKKFSTVRGKMMYF